MLVHKKNGCSEELDVEKLVSRVTRLCFGLDEKVDPREVALQAIDAAENGIQAAQLVGLAAEKAAALWKEHPDYFKLAARIGVTQLQREIPSTFSQSMKNISLLRREPGGSQILPMEFYSVVVRHAGVLNSMVKNDLDFEYYWTAYKELKKKYLAKQSYFNDILERPQQMWMRMSVMANSWNLDAVRVTYNLLSQKVIVLAPRSEVAAIGRGQANPGDIMPIWSTEISELLFDQSNNSAGDAGNPARAHCNHASADPLKRLTFLVPDLFMKRVREDGMWSLIDPERMPDLGTRMQDFTAVYEQCEADSMFVEQVEAQVIWKKILTWQLLFGCPRIIYFDAHYGKANVPPGPWNFDANNEEEWRTVMNVENEVAARNAVCINLPKFVADSKEKSGGFADGSKTFDFKKLHEVTKTVTRVINNNIENDYSRSHADRDDDFPVDFDPYVDADSDYNPSSDSEADDDPNAPTDMAAREAALYGPRRPRWCGHKRRRPINISLTGLADVFVDLKLCYDSEDARILCGKIYETVYHGALEASSELAAEYPDASDESNDSHLSLRILLPDAWGQPLYDNNPWNWSELRSKIATHGIRNSTFISLSAPSTLQLTFSALLDHPSSSVLPFAPVVDESVLNSDGDRAGFRKLTEGGKDVVKNESIWQVNPRLVRDLDAAGLWNDDIRKAVVASGGSIQHIEGIPEALKAIHRTAWEVSPESVLEMTSMAAPFVDQLRPIELTLPKKNDAEGQIEEHGLRPTKDQILLLSRLQTHAWKLGLPADVVIKEVDVPEPKMPKQKEELTQECFDLDAHDFLPSEEEDELSELSDSDVSADAPTDEGVSPAAASQAERTKKENAEAAAADDELDAMYKQAVQEFACAILPPALTSEMTARLHQAVAKFMEDLRKAFKKQGEIISSLYAKKMAEHVQDLGLRIGLIEKCGGLPLPSDDGQLKYVGYISGTAAIADLVREEREKNEEEHAHVVLIFNVKIMEEEADEDHLKNTIQGALQVLGVPFPPETEVKRIGYRSRPKPVRVEFPRCSGVTGREVVRKFWKKREEMTRMLGDPAAKKAVTFRESRSYFLRLRLASMFNIMRELEVNFPLIRARVHGGWACSFRGTDYFDAYHFAYQAIKLSDDTVIPLGRIKCRQKYALIKDPKMDCPGPDEDVRRKVEEEEASGFSGDEEYEYLSAGL